MRLLLYNPNTNAGLTEELAHAVARSLGPNDQLEVATATLGPEFIGSEETISCACDRLEEVLPDAAGNADAVLLGCFGDLGLDSIRRMLDKPVLSLWDGCLAFLKQERTPVGILTTSPFWVERLERDIASLDLQQRIGAISTIPAAPSLSRSDLSSAVKDGIEQMITDFHVGKVVLGGALLSVLPIREAWESPAVVDLFEITVRQCHQ